MIGSDDIFCCFILGNAMTWDDFFHLESKKETFQECIDSLLNTVRRTCELQPPHLLTMPRARFSSSGL